jgi:hypothetical protein
MKMRDAFKQSYRIARMVRQGKDAIAGAWADRAFFLAEAATDICMERFGHGDRRAFDAILEVHPAVLWAMHWRFCQPINVPPAGLSERHMGFALSEEGSRTWFARRLPA